MAFLEVRGIKKNFGSTTVLKGIDFDMNQGDVLSIIGSSGSGKTTLLRCINFLETADEGTISLNGDMIFNAATIKTEKASDIRTRRLNFGMVFQSFNLFPQYNVLNNVALAPELNSKNLIKGKRKELKNKYKDLSFFKQNKTINKDLKEYASLLHEQNIQYAKEIIERVGLVDKMYNYPCELSGGQCQRVAIARALAMRPNVLCFDEPTSALDPELTGEVLKVIKELKDKTNCTMIIVTHEMDFAKNVSDIVMYMADGIVEEIGTPKQVFNCSASEKTKSFLSKSLSDKFENDNDVIKDKPIEN